jgi:Fic family protein
MPENQDSSSAESESVEADRQTAQMGRNEPLGEVKPEPNSQTKNLVREILAKAQLVIQNKKRKKLDSILTLFAKRTSITNDEVEKLLHVSDATATRYLTILKKV